MGARSGGHVDGGGVESGLDDVLCAGHDLIVAQLDDSTNPSSGPFLHPGNIVGRERANAARTGAPHCSSAGLNCPDCISLSSSTTKSLEWPFSSLFVGFGINDYSVVDDLLQLCYNKSMKTAQPDKPVTAYVRDASDDFPRGNRLQVNLTDPTERDKVIVGFLYSIGVDYSRAESLVQTARESNVEVDSGNVRGSTYAIRIL